MCDSEMAELLLRDPEKPENWINRNVMKFSRETFCIWGGIISCQYRPGTISLSRSPSEKDLGVKVTKLNMSQQNKTIILM